VIQEAARDAQRREKAGTTVTKARTVARVRKSRLAP